MTAKKSNLKSIKALVKLMQDNQIEEIVDGELKIKMKNYIPLPPTIKPASHKDIIDQHVAKEKSIINIDQIIENDPSFLDWQISGGIFNRGN